ncbi:MAG: cytidylate kinase-like family protein, partial [Eggerthellaceae bacterium]|nr:cytidylate kinase-like family protein [Eggerthellaceae bacterium]
ADQGSCVIVGRCANAILKDRPCTFNVFIHAPLVPRIGRVMERENVDHMKADAMIERIDAERAEHCKHFTGTTWGDADAYHLSLDSSLEPSEKNAEIIAELAQAAFPSAPLKPNPKKPKKH